MKKFTQLFSEKDPVAATAPGPLLQPRDFVECLDVISAWNVQLSYNVEMAMDPESLQAALDTLVTCPFCAESYYFSDSVELNNSWLRVECPHCQVSPLEEEAEDCVA